MTRTIELVTGDVEVLTLGEVIIELQKLQAQHGSDTVVEVNDGEESFPIISIDYSEADDEFPVTVYIHADPGAI